MPVCVKEPVCVCLCPCLQEDEEDAGHKAATNWWAKIMERNKIFMEVRAGGGRSSWRYGRGQRGTVVPKVSQNKLN